MVLESVMEGSKIIIPYRLVWASIFLCLQIAHLSPVTGEDAAKSSRWHDVINHQATVDFAAQGTYSGEDDELGSALALGLDAYAKVSNSQRDLATIVLQLYGGRIDNHPQPARHFESSDDWDLFPRINVINFHLSTDRRFNLKVGHFEIPYGLEATINSNGTLRQFAHGSNLGMKLDWGATLNGTFPRFQYEVGVSRGSGMELHSRNDPYAIAGRIGTPIDTENFWGTPSFGLSFFQADIHRSGAPNQDRWRVGLDAQQYWGPFGALGELSYGETDSQDTVNLLLEANLSNRKETLLFYNQFLWLHQRQLVGWDEAGEYVVGIRYAPDTHWALSAQFNQELWQLANERINQLLFLQLRYRF